MPSFSWFTSREAYVSFVTNRFNHNKRGTLTVFKWVTWSKDLRLARGQVRLTWWRNWLWPDLIFQVTTSNDLMIWILLNFWLQLNFDASCFTHFSVSSIFDKESRQRKRLRRSDSDIHFTFSQMTLGFF